MAKELFRAVQSAEEKADQMIQEAQHGARELIKATEAEITAGERKITLEHRALYQSILAEKRASMEAMIAISAQTLQKKQDAELSGARARLNAVAQQIFERVWHDGNS